MGRGRGATYWTINVTSVRETGFSPNKPFLPFWPTFNHIFAILKAFEGRYRKLPRGRISGADVELSTETKISKKYWFVTELHRLQRNRKQRFRDWELYHFAQIWTIAPTFDTVLSIFKGRYRKMSHGRISGTDVGLSRETKISEKYWGPTKLRAPPS